MSALCDNVTQCLDGFDEHDCRNPRQLPVFNYGELIKVDYSPARGLVVTYWLPARRHEDTLCPETHFWCADRDLCLPVFVRCNGVHDCVGHEDEHGCDDYTCPGFYRCRASTICVHVTHVCDGWPLCPQHDDELMCSQACPAQCTCQGLAAFCSQVFAARQFPHLRYLDARGSGMRLRQLRGNSMLVHLNVARCGVSTVASLPLANLHSLDLSDNLLTAVSGHHLAAMPQLTVLFLAANPLISVFTVSAAPGPQLPRLEVLDLSRVHMAALEPGVFLALPALATLNLSHSRLQRLAWPASQLSGASLRLLDLRGCQLAQLAPDTLAGLSGLQRVLADDLRLCCPSALPVPVDRSLCPVTLDDVSSCEYLLGSAMYRVAVATLATLALLGNVASVTLRVCVRGTWRLSGGGVVLTHLCVADLGTGLYLATLGLADRLLDGRYLWQHDTWTRGALCQGVGGLALCCRHVATLLTTLLTLHRALQRWRPLAPRLTSAKAQLVCGAVWVSGLVLAVVPLLAQWRLYGQQALCVPLPHYRPRALPDHYSQGVTLLVPLALLLLCWLCEVGGAVYSAAARGGRADRDVQWLVWTSLTCGLLYTLTSVVARASHSAGHTPTHTALVYWGSVASCALNPYLHVYGVRAQMLQRLKEERLAQIVGRARGAP